MLTEETQKKETKNKLGDYTMQIRVNNGSLAQRYPGKVCPQLNGCKFKRPPKDMLYLDVYCVRMYSVW